VARVTGLVNVRAGPRSKRFKRRQIEALFDTAQPRFKFADQDAVADDGRMIFHDSAAETDHLLASLLVLRNGRASAARRSEATSARSDRMSAFNSAFMSPIAAFMSPISARISRRCWRTRPSGSELMRRWYPRARGDATSLKGLFQSVLATVRLASSKRFRNQGCNR
jgi:hypothetical protein